MKIHKEGWGTILVFWTICIVIMLVSIIFIESKWILAPILVIFTFLMVFITYFFRVPVRRGDTADPRAVTSVADGEVAIVERAYEGEYFKKECIQISVYMDFLNVHVNWWPISGEVTYYKYHPGKYFLAWMPKASELNEHTSVVVKGEYGEIMFRQIAGTFARRIVSYAKVGEHVTRGTQCGLIKFGSRIDMFIPVDSLPSVEIGDDVAACLSVLATLPSKSN